MLYRSRCLPLGRAVDISFSVLRHQRRQSQSINSIGTNKIQYDRHGGRRTLTTIGRIDGSTIRKVEPQSPVLPTRSLGLTLSGENSLLQTESRRFQELSQQLFSISEHVDCGSHWRSAARILVELRGLSLKSTAADPMDLTLDHFHAVFRTLLQACNKHSGMRYPDRMLAPTWSGELVTCCMGITHDSDGIGYTRRSWRPNFNFYTRLIHRLEEHFHPRADMSMDGHSLTPLLGEVYTQENIWLLAMSLEAYRGSKEIDAETEEEGFEGNQGEALTSTSSPRDIPSLSLVRNLFAAIEESDLEPARETINYILAIFESHSRASAADEWTSQAELESAALTGGESQVESTTSPSSSSEMDFLWRLWTDMDRIMHVHPDLLSLVLMIRLCFHHKRYRYLARILSDHDASTCLLESAQSILCGHQFAEPNLMMSALTHRSRVALRTDSNERMEFLGDSVLDVLVREAILRKVGLSNDSNNPNSFEKDLLPTQRLARIKGKFVSHSHLCALAREVGLSNLLLAANKNRGSGWFGNRNQSCLSPRSAQARPSKQLHENGSDMNVSDSLAEDVLEACIAALFLDKPDHAPPNRHKDDTITTPDIPIQQSSSDISSSRVNRNLIHQPFGYSAARQFFNLLMGPQLEKACEQACQAHRHRNRSDTGGNTDNRHTAVFQKHLNYKHLLDLWVRSIYTDDAGVCHARILYVLHGILGAHTHRVRVIVKVLPSGEVDRNRVRQQQHGESMNEIFANSQKKLHGQSYMNFLEAQERRRPGGTASSSTDTASSSTISFSVSPNYIPPLNPAYDRVFSAISETPELSTAEHRAAFTALQEWGAIRSGNKRKRRN